jgi:hypothetical protein
MHATTFCEREVPEAEVNVTPGGKDKVTTAPWL